MRAVNLLPRDAHQKRSIRDEDPAVVVGSAVGVIVIVALAGGFLTAHSRASAAQHDLTAAQLQLGKLSLQRSRIEASQAPAKPTKPIVPVPAVTAEQQPRVTAISAALATRISWDRILREFSLVLPDDVTIQQLSMGAPDAGATTPSGASAATTGGSFQITGEAFSHDSVARLLARLMLIPDLTDVTLTNSASNGKGVVTFAINATVKAPASPSTATATSSPAPTTTTTGAAS